MGKLCPCSNIAAKKSFRGFVCLLFSFYFLNAQAQDSASEIVLPYGPLTFYKALDTIKTQLNLEVKVGHDWDCPELSDNCSAHGPMTFNKFFLPLKNKGLVYLFVTVGKGHYLYIKRALRAPVKPKTFLARLVDENEKPLPGVTVQNLTAGESAAADDSGQVHFTYDAFPVNLYCTYVDRQPVSVTILGEYTVIVMEVDPQSLEAASILGIPTAREVSTGGYSTVVYPVAAPSAFRSTRGLPGISTGTVPSMLEGQVPGLLVTQTSGIPGSSSYLTIRGQSSIINGVDPLYVVDGVPFAGGNSSLSYIQSGSAARTLSPWSFIAPSDIERIDVLRDGDATAIYGSRGANGVILVTTKHWKAGLPQWDIEFSTGVNEAGRSPAFMNTTQYLGLRRQALQNSGLSDTTAPDLVLLDTTRNIDWRKWLLGPAAQLSNTKLAVSGGGYLNNYILGMDYLKEATPLPSQPDHDRLTMHFNYNHLSPDRRFTLHIAGLTGWDANHQFISADPTQFQNLAPDAPPLLNKAGGLNFPNGISFLNPLSVIRQPYEALSSNYLVSVIGSYRILTSLVFKTTVGVNRIHTREFGAAPQASQDPADSSQAMGYFSTTGVDSRVVEPLFEYKHKKRKLSTTWIAGASFQRLSNAAAARTDTGYISDIDLLRFRHALLYDTTSQSARDIYTAYYSSLNANWSDSYILNLTARRDGSSRFPPGQRFGNFGAIAFAWIFSGGHWMRRLVPWLSYGKLKLSEGVTGNNQIGDRTLQTIAGTSIQPFQSIAGLYPGSPPTSWEKTYKSEGSLDLGFWQNRILFNATFYRHRSDNLLQSPTFPMSSSGSNVTNWPVVLQNSGYEFSLTARMTDNPSFGWDAAINWTVPRSKVVSFANLSQSPYAGRLVVGQSINVLRGYVYAGIDKVTGLYRFADLNGDGQISPADQKVLGKFDVTGFGGFENTLRWKQFQLQVLVDARFATGVNYLAPLFVNNPPGTINDGLSSNVPRGAVYQRVFAASNTAADSTLGLYLNSSALFANTSFVRLSKISFVYTISAVRARAMHLSSLAFFIDAQNLLVFSPYEADPEIQSLQTMPTLKTIEFGVRLSH